ncbi:XRE family transcriptional regulator [Jannaschia sp. LMIT008]|uniref:XRE family transcriptional regulator n=1 Tax=Jannaschia maritima TaxID=3032585 RepID=UPI0028127B5B|nr:XRE family transcriptional regulator [Jannaschia sp. LMIT008]
MRWIVCDPFRKGRARRQAYSWAAGRLGVTQPRLNDLLRGKADKFSLDALIGLSARAGLAVKLDIRKVA